MKLYGTMFFRITKKRKKHLRNSKKKQWSVLNALPNKQDPLLRTRNLATLYFQNFLRSKIGSRKLTCFSYIAVKPFLTWYCTYLFKNSARKLLSAVEDYLFVFENQGKEVWCTSWVTKSCDLNEEMSNMNREGWPKVKGFFFRSAISEPFHSLTERLSNCNVLVCFSRI